MIFGMTIFTFVHLILSFNEIFSGLVVVLGLVNAKRLNGWTALFLVTTPATSVTGFALAAKRFPAEAVQAA